MARTNTNALKSETVLTPATKGKGKAETKALMALIAKAVTAVRTTVQSVTQMEPIVADALLAALKHCEKHKDAMPIDRLVKDVTAIPHPLTKALALEMVAWVKTNSPIYWDAKKAVHLRKPTEEGYKPFDIAAAEKTPFHQTEQAIKARKAGADAHKSAMKPLSFKDMFGRAMGLRKTFEQALIADKDGNVKGVVPADKAKIETLLDNLDKAARQSV